MLESLSCLDKACFLLAALQPAAPEIVDDKHDGGDGPGHGVAEQGHFQSVVHGHHRKEPHQAQHAHPEHGHDGGVDGIAGSPHGAGEDARAEIENEAGGDHAQNTHALPDHGLFAGKEMEEGLAKEQEHGAERNHRYRRHAQALEQSLGMKGGYRSTHIDKLVINEDGSLGKVKGTSQGVAQSGTLNPYEAVEAETIWNSAGINTRLYDTTRPQVMTGESGGTGNMVVYGMETGSWIGLKGVDFGDKGATEFVASICAGTEVNGVIQIRIDRLMGTVVGYLPVSAEGDGITYTEQTCRLLSTITGVHDVYFTFYGNGYSWDTWQFR